MDLGSFTATVTLKICCKEATSAQYVQKEQLYLLHVPTTFALFSPKVGYDGSLHSDFIIWTKPWGVERDLNIRPRKSIDHKQNKHQSKVLR